MNRLGHQAAAQATWLPFLLLGGRRLGFKLNTGGPAERVATWVLSIACLPLAWVAFGGPGV